MFIKKYVLTLTIALLLTSPIALYSAQANAEKPETEQETCVKQLRQIIEKRNDELLPYFLDADEEYRDALATFINEQDKDGSTLLHTQVDQKDMSIAQILIANGADINIQDANGDTPLHRGVQAGNVGFVSLLINAGANKELKNKNEKTPLAIANNVKPFHNIFSNIEIIITLLDGSYKDPLLDSDSDDNLSAAVKALELTKP